MAPTESTAMFYTLESLRNSGGTTNNYYNNKSGVLFIKIYSIYLILLFSFIIIVSEVHFSVYQANLT